VSSKRGQRFRPGDHVRCVVTGKVFLIERVAADEIVNYYLVSTISGNRGRPKSAAFLTLQIEDGYLIRCKPPRQTIQSTETESPTPWSPPQ